MNNYVRKVLADILGSDLPAAFDFERDFVARAGREQLVKAICNLRSQPAFERACCLELMKRDPSVEEWLLLAKSMDGPVSSRAVVHLLEHQPSLDALEYIVLAGSSTPAQRKRAAELLLNDATDATRLRLVLVRFQKGDIARRAWAFFKKQPIDRDDLHAILCDNKEQSVLKEAWAAFAAQNPTAVDLAWLISTCKRQAICNLAAELLLGTQGADAEQLSTIVQYASTPRLLNAAAEKLLALDANPEQLAHVPIRVRDRALADAAWKRIARQKISKRSWRTVELRNILCLSVHPHIRKAALPIALQAPFDQDDRDFIVKHSPDTETKRAFKATARRGS